MYARELRPNTKDACNSDSTTAKGALSKGLRQERTQQGWSGKERGE